MAMAPAANSSMEHAVTKIPHILPHERVFPIQIGSELFKLSGASLSSDAPSYFSQYFMCQIRRAQQDGEDPSTAVRTLYIDRDPVTFKDISLHLQGYHVKPRDGTHFVRLFADAQFYNLPKLISQLYDESIFMSIGHREFQIPRDLFSGPGNLPNYFSLGFAMFFSSPTDLFPGLDREGLLRPPSIMPPSVPGRSADTFAELLHLLRGYPLHVRDNEHRAALLRDCRYFNFKGLEQQLIPCALVFNPIRRRHDIFLRLEDILKSGVSVVPDSGYDPHADTDSDPVSSSAAADPLAARVTYTRPYLSDPAADLIFEVGGGASRLHFPPTPPPPPPHSSSPSFSSSLSSLSLSSSPLCAEFFGEPRTRLARLLELVLSKLDQPSQPAQPRGLFGAEGVFLGGGLVIPVILGPEASVVLDGEPWYGGEAEVDDGSGGGDDGAGPLRKRRRVDASSSAPEGYEAGGGRGGSVGATAWTVKTGQWRLRVRSATDGGGNGRSSVECVLVVVKLDAVSSERAGNAARGFLGS